MAQSKQQRTLDEVSRRGFLAVGGVGLMGLSLGETRAAAPMESKAVIHIVMNGGLSHLDSLDPKPDAPREIRGPVRSIETSIPGVRFAESLPELAQRAHELVVLRSLFHDAAPIHETGLQLLLTGSLVRKQIQPPNIGVVLNRLLKAKKKAPIAVRLGGTIHETGLTAYHGDESGCLAREGVHDVETPERLRSAGFAIPEFDRLPEKQKRVYGETRFGKLLWTAARYVEAGVRYVEVNTFDQMFGEVTWDIHGCSESAPGTIMDCRDTLLPQFDRAVSALFADLQSTGLWKQTLVVSAGEMGRSPAINSHLGRDHWPHVWSGFLAGGGLNGGQVIGASDASGEAVADQPIHLSDIPGLIGGYLCNSEVVEVPVDDQLTWSLPPANLCLA